MSRLLSLFLILAVATAARLEASPHEEDFDALFRRVLEEHGVPGGAYAIVQDGNIVRTAGYGVRSKDGNEPVNADTVFRIASVSKTFAAQLTALLVNEQKLSWEDRLNQYVPDLRFKRGEHAAALQVRHLLGQSTGIVPNAYDNLLEADIPLDNILPRFSELDPLCAPGLCYTYQNILFGLIGPIVQHATQLPYGTLLQQRIFEPLDMFNASVGMDALLASDNHAAPHVRRRGEWHPAEVRQGYYQVAPAAGINASVNDLANWLIAQLGHRPEVIPPELVEQLTSRHVRTPRDLRRRHWRDMLTDAHYGMGWRIYEVGDEELYLHSGWVKGYVADVAYSRTRRTGLVVLLNAESGAISEITSTFWKGVLNGAMPIPMPDLIAAHAGESLPAEPSSVAHHPREQAR